MNVNTDCSTRCESVSRTSGARCARAHRRGLRSDLGHEQRWATTRETWRGTVAVSTDAHGTDKEIVIQRRRTSDSRSLRGRGTLVNRHAAPTKLTTEAVRHLSFHSGGKTNARKEQDSDAL